MRKEKKLFKKIRSLKALGKNLVGTDHFDRSQIYSKWLDDIGLALFFSYCTEYEFDYNQCVALIRILSKCRFKKNPDKVFSKWDHKEQCITIWEVMKRYFKGEVEIYWNSEGVAIVTNRMLDSQSIHRELKMHSSRFSLKNGKQNAGMVEDEYDVLFGEVDFEAKEKLDIIRGVLEKCHLKHRIYLYDKTPVYTRVGIMILEEIYKEDAAFLKDEFRYAFHSGMLHMSWTSSEINLEIPNPDFESIPFERALTDAFLSDKGKLLVLLGQFLDRDILYDDIEHMENVLIAGTKNSGKSTFLHTMLASLMMKNTPEDVRFILIDLDENEFLPYKNIPYLATPVITNPKIALGALNWCMREFERRWKIFRKCSVRDIKEYRLKSQELKIENLPSIIVFIEEYMDILLLLGSKTKEIKDLILSLVFWGNQFGFHFILSTKCPTAYASTDFLKDRMATHIAFRTNTEEDSKDILDETGTEALFGKGDMYYKDESSRKIRVQGIYIDKIKIEALCKQFKNKYELKYLVTSEEILSPPPIPDEDLYAVADFCIRTGEASLSATRDYFDFWFRELERIFKELERRHILSPIQENGERSILVDMKTLDEMFHKNQE